MDRAAVESIGRESLSDAAAAGAPGTVTGTPVVIDQATLDAAEAKAWSQIPSAFGKVLAIGLPELAEHYSGAACLAWGEQMVEVAKLHGWTSKIVGPYVGLALAAVPMAVPTYVAIKMRREGASGRVIDAERERSPGRDSAPIGATRPVTASSAVKSKAIEDS